VNEKLSYGTTMKREKELLAVKKVIEDENLDPQRLRKIRNGRSEMAKEGSYGEKAGRTTVHRKKV
jgi:hypothetical protein